MFLAYLPTCAWRWAFESLSVTVYKQEVMRKTVKIYHAITCYYYIYIKQQTAFQQCQWRGRGHLLTQDLSSLSSLLPRAQISTGTYTSTTQTSARTSNRKHWTSIGMHFTILLNRTKKKIHAIAEKFHATVEKSFVVSQNVPVNKPWIYFGKMP